MDGASNNCKIQIVWWSEVSRSVLSFYFLANSIMQNIKVPVSNTWGICRRQKIKEENWNFFFSLFSLWMDKAEGLCP
jgi:hypothetical protein